MTVQLSWVSDSALSEDSAAPSVLSEVSAALSFACAAGLLIHRLSGRIKEDDVGAFEQLHPCLLHRRLTQELLDLRRTSSRGGRSCCPCAQVSCALSSLRSTAAMLAPALAKAVALAAEHH
jgi:hypothetical protein